MGWVGQEGGTTMNGIGAPFGLSGLLKQDTADFVAFKQQTFTPHSSGGWESEIRVPACTAPRRALSGVQTADFCTHT